MQARDLMTTDVISVKPETSVKEAAQIMLRHRISGLPVVDNDGRLVGIVSEGDLLPQADGGARERRSWWLELLATAEQRALEYVRSHASRVGDIMTRKVISVDEDTSVSRIAALLEEKRIKRVPVCSDGRLVGIVSRADILQCIAMAEPDQTAPDDAAIRQALMKRLREEAGVRDWLMNATVKDGIVHLWGGARSEAERRAARVAAETINGVRGVEDHLAVLPYMGAE